MRYKVLTNMNKDDKKAAEILIYMRRCAEATEKIPVPEGMKLLFQLVPKGAEATKVAKLAQVMHLKMTDQLTEALAKTDVAAERSRKKKK